MKTAIRRDIEEEMLRIVCWKWHDPRYRWRYTAPYVNRLANMVRRHYHNPFEFCCITDDPKGLASDIRVIPLWDDLRHLGGCWLRLRAFASDIREIIGERYVSIDLDTVIVDDVTDLWTRPEPFVIAGEPGGFPYNGSMWLMTSGMRAQVWERFDPQSSPIRAEELGYWGGDQAWIAACLGRGEATWTQEDGIFSYKYDILPKGGLLPPGARIIIFPGAHMDPIIPEIRSMSPWIADHWR